MGRRKRQVQKPRSPEPARSGTSPELLDALGLVELERWSIEATVAGQMLDQCAAEARKRGASWGQVARATGFTAEGARRRWGP